MTDSLRFMARLTNVALATALLLAVSLPAGGLTAQETDSRWTPWLGCWNAAAEEAPMVCFQPHSGDAGVELLTVVDGEIASQETLIADGQDREVSREGCEGWERAEFSEDANRVYFYSELVCGGNRPSNSTGLMSMPGPLEWIDIKSVEVDGQSAPFVMRYRLAPAAAAYAAGLLDVGADLGLAIRTARIGASRSVTLDDVVEVSSRLDTQAVEAWIAETNEPFDLNAEALMGVADSGVPESVIDLMVAVSFPDKFAIDRGPEGVDSDIAERADGRRSAYGYYGSYYNDPFFMGRYYSPYYGNSYSSYGYGSIYGFGGYGVYRPTVVVVDRRDDGGVVRNVGRAISGRGYSRRGGSGGSRGSSASSGGSSGSSGSSARSSGSSGSRSSSGRKAKPRGGGL